MRRVIAIALVLLAGTVACSGNNKTSSPKSPQPQELIVQVASYDLAPGEQRFIVGLLTPDQQFVSYGEVAMEFSYLGTSEQSPSEPSSKSTGTFLLVPGETQNQGPVDGPIIGPPSQGRGVYATGANFDRPGFWQVSVTAAVRNAKPIRGEAAFQVFEKHRVPAPGDEALPTENLTLQSPGAPSEAIDSRGRGGEPIPDDLLHQTTIAAALKARRPALVVFATPVYCLSRFCGPVTDTVLGLARTYGNRADFIHVEIWRSFQNKEINDAARDWLFRDGDLTEPWVFLIGSDGKIAARWDNVATREEMEPLLQALPAT